MTQDEKQLLFKDLYARLPYGVKVHTWYNKPIDIKCTGVDVYTNVVNLDIPEDDAKVYIDNVKPYLRPMSSMTEEEKDDYENYTLHWCDKSEYGYASEIVDYLNQHHFDYRGLIPMGLALEAKEGMYE